MQIPGTLSLIFLAYLILVLPWLAFRSSRYLKRHLAEGDIPGKDERSNAAGAPKKATREAIWKSTLFMLGCLLALSWITARSFQYSLFRFPEFRSVDLAWSVSCLLGLLGLRSLARTFRKPEERPKMMVYQLTARSRREWFLQAVTVLMASVSEEAAYRGVGPAIFDYMTDGRAWIGWAACSLAFAGAHWIQGWRSMVVIFLIALMMHMLVMATNTLIWAMAVHGIYDFIAIHLISREAKSLSPQPVRP